MSQSFDVVVIGAGAAGLAAGARLRAAGVAVAVVEAAERVGGRAHTDVAAFGVPWDKGCHWLHSASVNPFRIAADELGLGYYQRGNRQTRATHLGDRWADAAERQAVWEAIDGAFAAVKHAGEQGRDIAASEVLDTASPWLRMSRHWLALMSATEAERVSTLDYVAYSDTAENYPVEKGYGALVLAVAARAAPDLEVTLGCPVERLDWSGPGVALDTPKGRLSARYAVVAVPTTAIARGRLRFAPDLPPDLAEAFEALPLGSAEKVAFQFDRDVFGVPPVTYVDTIDLRDPSRIPVNFTLNPFGHAMAIAQLGGANAERLVGEGPAAMVDFALAALVDAYGADIRARVLRTATTGWVADPLIGGAYSCALPGKAHMRARLAQVVGDKVFFAGEAVSPHYYSTAHGAHETGLAAADAVLARLARHAA
ncbi:flavin monoamine oxidase family protein [Ancylobacter lacus]|uniref:flavin monoamine oxidase family protein n=1 Tax=Ancylobacter lacus TaxID=2579970 RepID=UPI001BCD2861|nr:FAD-dependent oxidoreductase [Ancylobacter lacus]